MAGPPGGHESTGCSGSTPALGHPRRMVSEAVSMDERADLIHARTMVRDHELLQLLIGGQGEEFWKRFSCYKTVE